MSKSVFEKTQECIDECEIFTKENPMKSLCNTIDEIAKDIRERQDNAMAMEFTRTIAELLRENGIAVHCTEHDKKFTDKIKKLEEENERLRKAYDRHRRKIAELESELSAKENLLKIKSAVHGEMPIDELSYEEVSESYTFGELVSLCCRQSGEIRRLEDEKREWLSDRIQVNKLNAAIDDIVERCLELRNKERG